MLLTKRRKNLEETMLNFYTKCALKCTCRKRQEGYKIDLVAIAITFNARLIPTILREEVRGFAKNRIPEGRLQDGLIFVAPLIPSKEDVS